MFVPPEHFDFRVLADGSPDYWMERIVTELHTEPAAKARIVGRRRDVSLYPDQFHHRSASRRGGAVGAGAPGV
jgi:hypothetical protein